ncbi:translation initiation factor 2 [Labrys neptuniae]
MKQFILLCLVGLLMASCSTVTRGTTNQIQVISNPSAAQVRTSIGNACTTPCTFEVSRKSEFIATISKEGHKPVDVPVKTRVAGAGAAGFAGNIVAGGIIGMGVDAATGATLEHYPNPINVSLEPNTPAVVNRSVRRNAKARKPKSSTS